MEPTPKRSASINFRQAIGIFVFVWACILAFSVVVSFFINAIRIIFFEHVNTPERIGGILGMGAAVLIFLFITNCFFALAVYLLRDPKGYDWKGKRM